MPSELAKGLLGAAGTLCIWSGFFVVSRAGAQTGLTAFDMTALRFLVAGLLVLPFAARWWPYHLPLRAQAAMAACGPGMIYSLLMYQGLSEATVAYAGVFANGAMPILTSLIAYLLAREKPKARQVLPIAAIVLGAIIIGIPGMTAGSGNLAVGILSFLTASGVLSFYVYGLRHWQVTPQQALAIVNLPNAILFLPVWLLLLPTGLQETSWTVIAVQALYQGLGPGFLAVICFAMAARYLGPSPTAAISASVPAAATLLAIPVLGEIPNTIEWTGLVIVSCGLLALVWRRS